MKKDLLVFDMDGVLVDVSESYRAAIQATVKHFTGDEPTRDEIQQWKNRGGFNDDWHLSHRMIHERGGSTTHPHVVDHFQHIFHGDGSNGLILRERWLAADGLFERLSRPIRLPSSQAACAGKRSSRSTASRRFISTPLSEPAT